MKKIEVIISPDAADRVIELLEEQSVSDFTLSSILARDSSGTRPRMYRGHSYTAALLSKLKVEAVVPDNRASAIASAIMAAAQGPGCSPDLRAVIIPVTEVVAESTESSSKTPRALKHRRLHPGAQPPGVPADAAPAGPIPLHLAKRISSALTALLGPAGDAKTRTIGRPRSRSLARITVVGPPD